MKRQGSPTTKELILDAVVMLAAERGVEAATVRSIAARVGITEGAVYRHFDSKLDLLRQAYGQVLDAFVTPKEQIEKRDISARRKLAAWVRHSYEFFDANTHQYCFLLFTRHDVRVYGVDWFPRLGAAFSRIYDQGIGEGLFHPMKAPLALCHFAGVVTNVTRLIWSGHVPGPALHYTDEVTHLLGRMFEVRAPGARWRVEDRRLVRPMTGVEVLGGSFLRGPVSGLPADDDVIIP